MKAVKESDTDIPPEADEEAKEVIESKAESTSTSQPAAELEEELLQNPPKGSGDKLRVLRSRLKRLIMPVVEVHQLFQSNPALESCVEWFVNSTQRCMATSHELRPDDRGVTCNVYMAPYLKLCFFSMFARNISCGCWLAQLSQNSWPARCVATISHRCFA